MLGNEHSPHWEEETEKSGQLGTVTWALTERPDGAQTQNGAQTETMAKKREAPRVWSSCLTPGNLTRTQSAPRVNSTQCEWPSSQHRRTRRQGRGAWVPGRIRGPVGRAGRAVGRPPDPPIRSPESDLTPTGFMRDYGNARGTRAKSICQEVTTFLGK